MPSTSRATGEVTYPEMDCWIFERSSEYSYKDKNIELWKYFFKKRENTLIEHVHIENPVESKYEEFERGNSPNHTE